MPSGGRTVTFNVEFFVIVAILLLSKVYFWPISAVKFCGKVIFVSSGIEYDIGYDCCWLISIALTFKVVDDVSSGSNDSVVEVKFVCIPLVLLLGRINNALESRFVLD